MGNSLQDFRIDFEYNETYPEIRKALKQRTIKALKRIKKHVAVKANHHIKGTL